MKQEVLNYISQMGAEEIADILDAAMNRYRKLYPDWEITYCAAEKNDPQARQRILDFLARLDADK